MPSDVTHFAMSIPNYTLPFPFVLIKITLKSKFVEMGRPTLMDHGLRYPQMVKQAPISKNGAKIPMFIFRRGGAQNQGLAWPAA
jgi:prolyl oligopeptidase PreP (S9A serine peptidase family)